MRAIDVIYETLSHFVKQDDSPPPGIPVRVEAGFERKLLRLCEWHSLSPIVLESFQKLALGPVLSEFSFERLKNLTSVARTRTDEVLTATKSLVESLRDRGVSFMLVDDVAFALALYPSRHLRPIGHIDLLVREDQWKTLHDVCRAEGFVRHIRGPDFHDVGEALFYYQHLSPCTFRNTQGITLGLRFRILDVGRPERSEAARRRGRMIGGIENGMARASVEDLLIRSCIRLNMSRFEKLLFAVDTGLILARYGHSLDWDYIEKRSRARSFGPALFFTCERVLEWLELPRVSVGISRPGRLRRKIFDVIWHPGRLGLLGRKPTRLHRRRYCFVECGSLSDKLWLFAKLLTPRREWVAAFFEQPCKPWLRIKFIILTFKNRLGMPLARGEDLRYQ